MDINLPIIVSTENQSKNDNEKIMFEKAQITKKFNNYQRILDYFDSHQSETQAEINPYNFNYNKKNKMATLKKNMKNPLEIREEAYRKFDRENNKKSIEANNITSTSREWNVKSHFNSQILNTSRNLHKNDQQSKKIDNLLILENTSYNTFKDLRVYDLVSTITDKPKENILFKNYMESVKVNFPNILDDSKVYLSYDIKYNTENKHIQLFILAVNLLTERLKEEEKSTLLSKDNNIPINKDKFIEKAKEVINSLFKDFCLHLNLYSRNRSEFLDKIWQLKTNYDEELRKISNKKLNSQYENNLNLKNENVGLSDKVRELENKLKEFSKKNEKMKQDMKTLQKIVNEKDESILLLEKSLKEKSDIIEDLNEKIQLIQQTKSRIKPDGETLVNMFHTLNSGSVGFDIKDILTHRKSRLKDAGDLKRNFKERISRVKEAFFYNRRLMILEQSVLNYDQPKNYDFSSNHMKTKNKLLFNLYLNKGIEMNIEQFKHIEVQTDITSAHLEKLISGKFIEKINDSTKDVSTKIDKISDTLQNIQNSFTTFCQKDLNIMTFTPEQSENYLASEMNEPLVPLEIENKSDQLSLFEKKLMKNKIPLDGRRGTYNKFFTPGLDNELISTNENFTDKKIINRSTKDLMNIDQKLNESKELTNSLNNSIIKITEEMKAVLNECDIILKENYSLKEKVEKEKDQKEELKENYHEVLQMLAKNIVENNEEINNYIEQNNQIPKQVMDFLRKILEKNFQFVDKDKNKILNNLNKHIIKESNNRREFKKQNNIAGKRERIYSQNTYFKDFVTEFLCNHEGKINVGISVKNVVKIVDNVFFDLYDKYFKKDEKLVIDPEIVFDPEFLPFNYFMQNFGLETLAKKKYFEFLQACLNNIQIKRVEVFCSLINLNTEAVSSLPIIEIFEKKQIIIFLQYVKMNHILLDYKEDEIKLYVLHNKVIDMISRNFKHLLFNQDSNKRFNDFIEKYKTSITKDFKNYVVIDFDELLIVIYDLINEMKKEFSSFLKVIFNSFDLDEKDQISYFDYICIHHYIFKEKISLNQITSYFQIMSENEYLNFSKFESSIYDYELFKYYENLNEYKKNLDLSDIAKIMRKFYDELNDFSGQNQGNFYKFYKRIITCKSNPNLKNNYYLNYLLSKLDKIKLKLKSAFNDEKSYEIIWMSIRFFDDISNDLLNEYNLLIHFSLESIYRDFNDVINKNTENSILSTVFSEQIQ